MPTQLPVRLSLLEANARLSRRAFAALMLWAFALPSFTLPTAAAHHDGEAAYVAVLP